MGWGWPGERPELYSFRSRSLLSYVQRLLRSPPPTGLLWEAPQPQTLAGPHLGPGFAATDVPASWLVRFAR